MRLLPALLSALPFAALAAVLTLVGLAANREGWYELTAVVMGTLVLLGAAEHVSLRRTGRTISRRITEAWREGRRGPALALFLGLAFVTLWLVLHWLGLF